MRRFLDAAREPEPPIREPIPALLRIEGAVRQYLAGDDEDLRAILADALGHPVEGPLEEVLDAAD